MLSMLSEACLFHFGTLAGPCRCFSPWHPRFIFLLITDLESMSCFGTLRVRKEDKRGNRDQ